MIVVDVGRKFVVDVDGRGLLFLGRLSRAYKAPERETTAMLVWIRSLRRKLQRMLTHDRQHNED